MFGDPVLKIANKNQELILKIEILRYCSHILLMSIVKCGQCCNHMSFILKTPKIHHCYSSGWWRLIKLKYKVEPQSELNSKCKSVRIKGILWMNAFAFLPTVVMIIASVTWVKLLDGLVSLISQNWRVEIFEKHGGCPFSWWLQVAGGILGS